MSKKFTLIEIVVAIVIMTILVSIVIVGTLEFKKKSIQNTMAQNIRILQGTVDEYYLKNDAYPIKNQGVLTLGQPQLIDISLLKDKEYLKKELDTSKIKTQYYWVDVFGKVWGATKKDISSINLLEGQESKRMEFVLGSKSEGYNVYEVSGYKHLANVEDFKFVNEFASTNIKDEKAYKLVQETKVKGGDKKVLNFSPPKPASDYLISVVDEYGLESAPFGPFGNQEEFFKPILNKEGTYEFEIESSEVMYWLNFLYMGYTPGDTTIEFDFKVKDESGNYTEWTDDFYSLKESTGIVVRVLMKGDKNGNKPSLYNLRVLYKFKDQEVIQKAIPVPEEKAKPIGFTCPHSPIKSTLSRVATSAGTGNMVYEFYENKRTILNKNFLPKVTFHTGVSYTINSEEFYISLDNSTYVPYESGMNVKERCMVVVYNVTIHEVPPTDIINATCEDNQSCASEYCAVYEDCPVSQNSTGGGNSDTGSNNSGGNEGSNNGGESNNGSSTSTPSCVDLSNCPTPEIIKVCGSGGTHSSSSSDVKRTIVYAFKLEGEEKLSSLEITPSIIGYNLSSVSLEYSINGEPYELATSVLDIPAGSCVNIVYKLDEIPSKAVSDTSKPSTPEIIEPPVFKTCTDDCPQPCLKDCTTVSEVCIVDCNAYSSPKWCETNPCEPINQDKDDKNSCIGPECSPSKCVEECTSPPQFVNPKDTELNDTSWTTVDKLSFFSQGPLGERIRWYRAEHRHNIVDDENTRIIYRYSKSSNWYWSREYEDFTTTGEAVAVVGYAYIQVKTSELKNVSEENYPTVTSMKFYNEKGYDDISLVQPSLIIVPKKDNNRGRETISNESNIEWDYLASDPRNKEIINIEWAGDIRSKYPVGKYEVRARVMNDVAIWSNWVTYKFEVFDEKPVAKIEYEKKWEIDNFSYYWDFSNSYDADGDEIVDFETTNVKEIYEEGTQLVRIRVQDAEGYWSEWTEVEIYVGLNGIKEYRLEAEDYTHNRFTHNGVFVTQDVSASNGKVLEFVRASDFIEFKFIGTGFDISLEYNTYLLLSIDGVYYTLHNEKFKKSLYEMRELENKEHTVRIIRGSSYPENRITVDYIDIYGTNVDPKIQGITSHIMYKDGTVFNIQSNTFSLFKQEKLKIDWSFIRDSVYSKSYIVNENGETVRLLSEHRNLKGGTYGSITDIWDGYDNSGKKVKEGKYYFKVEVIGVNGGKKEVKQHEIFVDTTEPIYRLEAEHLTGDERIVSKGMSVINLEGSSNGKVAITGNAGSYIEFIFEGTGFDLSYDPKPYTTITLVGYPEYSKDVTTGDNKRFTVRDLEYKKHVLRIFSGSTGRNVPIDYLDVYSSNYKPTIKNISSNIQFSDGKVSHYNSIDFSKYTNQSIKVNYRTYENQYVKIEILDSNNNLIKNVFNNKYHNGGSDNYYSFVWDGYKNDGTLVENGEYKILFTSVGLDNKSTSSSSYTVRIDNERPVYRIEAEGSSPQITHSGRTIENDVIKLSRAGSYIEFKFIGTGFDLKWDPKPYTVLTIDDLPAENQTLQSSSMITVRNLELKEHTVKVFNGTTGSSMSVDYLDVFNR